MSNEWDQCFHAICVAIAGKSPCLSRKIGAILVRDKSIISTGYNGPARGIPHCGHERFMKDKILETIVESCLGNIIRSTEAMIRVRLAKECPRKVLGYISGTYMEFCPAQHAEENCISNAARIGVSTISSTLYMNSVIPCKNCFSTLINAGIIEIVVDEVKVYDKYSQFIIDNSSIPIRPFNH